MVFGRRAIVAVEIVAVEAADPLFHDLDRRQTKDAQSREKRDARRRRHYAKAYLTNGGQTRQ
jgi:hypothetical protein